jgi:hypothetical protein
MQTTARGLHSMKASKKQSLKPICKPPHVIILFCPTMLAVPTFISAQSSADPLLSIQCQYNPLPDYAPLNHTPSLSSFSLALPLVRPRTLRLSSKCTAI